MRKISKIELDKRGQPIQDRVAANQKLIEGDNNMSQHKSKGTIQRWALVDADGRYHGEPKGDTRIVGEVYGYEGEKDGQYIRTSAVQLLNRVDGVVTTKNSSYKLGTPSEFYNEYLNKPTK